MEQLSPVVLITITPQLSHRFTWMAMLIWEPRMCKERKPKVHSDQFYKAQVNKNCSSVSLHSLHTFINTFPVSRVSAFAELRTPYTSNLNLK